MRCRAKPTDCYFLVTWRRFDRPSGERNNDVKGTKISDSGAANVPNCLELSAVRLRLTHEPGLSDDASLIAATLNGETAAFGQLVTQYQDRLFNSLLRVLNSSDD